MGRRVGGGENDAVDVNRTQEQYCQESNDNSQGNPSPKQWNLLKVCGLHRGAHTAPILTAEVEAQFKIGWSLSHMCSLDTQRCREKD